MLDSGYWAAVVAAGLLLEGWLGWPDLLFRFVRHPVVWMGRLISILEIRLNQVAYSDPRRWRGGVLTVVVVVGVSVLLSVVVLYCSRSWLHPLGVFVVDTLLAASLLAARNLYSHVLGVLQPLAAGDLIQARLAVAKIVGRDVTDLNEAGIAGAALESLAENTSDGVIAPVLWGVCLGLPGMVAYKSINTLDSMLGHRNPRYELFGRFAARLDDVVNWLPARLCGVLYVLAAPTGKAMGEVWRITRKDAPLRRSPNAGWPEAAMAACLGVRLGGPKRYDETPAAEPWLNQSGRLPLADDIDLGLRLYLRVHILLLGLLASFVVFLWL